MIDVETLRSNDFNLNIRRYADNAPPPEPHDVRAHLLGGVPRAEVAAKEPLFAAHGFRSDELLQERDERYLAFRPEIAARQSLKPAIEGNPGVLAKEHAVRKAFDRWWNAHASRITKLAGQPSFVGVRNDLLKSFSAALDPLALLDAFQVRGIVAGFWDQSRYDFLTLMARGGKGIIDAWRTSIITALEDEESKNDPLDHKLVRFLLSDFVAQLAELEAKKAGLEAQFKAAMSQSENGEDEDASEEEGENAVDEAQLAVWKQDLSATKKQLKASEGSFVILVTARR